MSKRDAHRIARLGFRQTNSLWFLSKRDAHRIARLGSQSSKVYLQSQNAMRTE